LCCFLRIRERVGYPDEEVDLAGEVDIIASYLIGFAAKEDQRPVQHVDQRCAGGFKPVP